MEEIYLDNAATTKIDKSVLKEIEKVLLENYGNASSLHTKGRKAKEILETAREKIAESIGAEASEIIFTSGGTESDNLALKGLALANPEKKHIITSVIEHPAVLETCRELEKQGMKVDYISVDEEGIINVEELKNKIREDTLVVSVMHVNNEIGTIQPIEEIGELCKEKKIYFHTDAVQSFNKIDIDVNKMNISLLSVSGHKIHAPKGIGFLYIKKGTKISPIIHGGGQEKNLRSGTENISGAVGLAASLDIETNKESIKKSRDKLAKELMKIPGARINGSMEKRVYNNLNISFYGIEGESLMLMLNEEKIYVSTGSACASNKLAESYVLKAIKTDDLYIHGSIRITLDKITDKEVSFVIEKITQAVNKLREMSPFKLNSEELK